MSNPRKPLNKHHVRRLLEASDSLTIHGKKEELRKLGYRVEGARSDTITKSLIEVTGSVETALAAAMDVWVKAAKLDDMQTMIQAAKRRRGPPQGEHTAAIKGFFCSTGEPSDLGKWVLSYIRRTPSGRDNATNARHSVQGGRVHMGIQSLLCHTGDALDYIVKTDYQIGGGYQPDVLWYRLDPCDKEHPGGAHFVFEIESVGTAAALNKSLASLKHAHDRWGSQYLFLIAPRHRLAAIEARVGGPLGGAFHEIQSHVRFIAIEECPTSLDGLWQMIQLIKERSKRQTLR